MRNRMEYPIWPPAPVTVTWTGGLAMERRSFPTVLLVRRCLLRCCLLEAVDDGRSELGALDLGGAIHQAGEIVGHDLVRNGGLQRVHDVRGGVVPADVLEHEHPREEHRAGVHLVLPG